MVSWRAMFRHTMGLRRNHKPARTQVCPTCIGWGQVRCVRTPTETLGKPCPECKGKGRVPYASIS